MKRNLLIVLQVLSMVLLMSVAVATPARSASTGGKSQTEAAQAPEVAAGTAFTYQGQLNFSNSPANGQYDFEFKLFNALTGGTQTGTTQTALNVNVANGLFTVQIDFGPMFGGQALWLEIGVRQANTGNYVTLTPRQPLTATPYAQGLVPGAIVAESRSTSMFGVVNTGSGTGIYGNSTGGYGLNGISASSEGVHGESTSGDGIHGKTSAANKSGVWGESTGGGVGVAGSSISGGGVQGTSNSGEGVFGSSQNYNGVHGRSSHASSSGVWGESTTNGVGVAGNATGTGKAIYGVNTNAVGWAGYFDGNLHATGRITKAYTAGTSSQAVPIAYGNIESDGTILVRTPNVASSTYNASTNYYEITITGETYIFYNYVTVVTPSFTGGSPVMAATYSVNGKLQVGIYNLSGNRVQTAFQFVIYKP